MIIVIVELVDSICDSLKIKEVLLTHSNLGTQSIYLQKKLEIIIVQRLLMIDVKCIFKKNILQKELRSRFRFCALLI